MDRLLGFAVPEAVPSLRGRGWWFFLALWVPALALCLIGAGYAAIEVGKSRTPPTYLIGISMDSGPLWTLGPPVGEEAIRAGIRKGDRLVAVNGEAAADYPAGLIEQISGPVGGALTVTTVDPQGRRSEHRLTRDPKHFEQGVKTAGLSTLIDHVFDVFSTYVLGALLPIILAMLLLAQRARDPLAPWASLMMLVLTLGNGAIADWLYLSGDLGAQFTGVANEVGFDLLVAVLAIFPDARLKPRATWAVLLLAPIAIHLSAGTDRFTRSAILLSCVAAAIGLIFARVRQMPEGFGRQQIRWALGGFFGSLAALGGLALIQYIKPQIGSFAAKEWAFILGTLCSTLMVAVIQVGITIALLRYRLYDADITISRSIAYGVLTFGLIGTFAATQKVVELLSTDYVGSTLGGLAQALSAGLAAVLVVPLNRRVTGWVQGHFQGGLVDLRERFPRLIADLRETVSPDELARFVVSHVQRGVHATCSALILDGRIASAQHVSPAGLDDWLVHWKPPANAKGFHSMRSDPLFPVRIALTAESVGHVGWLLLGARPDGSFYGRDERSTLLHIADPIAYALAISIRRKAHEAERRDDVGTLRQLVDQLHARLDWIETRVPGADAGHR